MIIVLKPNLTIEQEKDIRKFLNILQIEVIPVLRSDHALLVVIGKFSEHKKREVQSHSLVEKVIDTNKPYKLASKSFKQTPTKIKINNKVTIGDNGIVIMAGPCSVETKLQIMQIAKEVKAAGGQILRGGAFKPRTAPYDFQGLGKIGLHFLKEAGMQYDLPVITEIMDVRQIELMDKYTDIFQVGTRNMQNYSLLKELGKSQKPVLLKRGMWATYKEFLLAAEYILVGGNENVILCERGIRTHIVETRFTLDLNVIPYLKQETHLPVFVDPSHGTGKASFVHAMSKAAVAAGADGLLLETHLDPRMSVSDADQTISLTELKKIIKDTKIIKKALNKTTNE